MYFAESLYLAGGLIESDQADDDTLVTAAQSGS